MGVREDGSGFRRERMKRVHPDQASVPACPFRKNDLGLRVSVLELIKTTDVFKRGPTSGAFSYFLKQLTRLDELRQKQHRIIVNTKKRRGLHRIPCGRGSPPHTAGHEENSRITNTDYKDVLVKSRRAKIPITNTDCIVCTGYSDFWKPTLSGSRAFKNPNTNQRTLR